MYSLGGSIEDLQTLYTEEVRDLELWNDRGGGRISTDEDIDSHLGDLLLVFDVDIDTQRPNGYQVMSETLSNTLLRL